MTIAARNYTSGAEIIANANLIHRRLMNPAKRNRPELVVVSAPSVDRPAWQIRSTDFDQHVKAWEKYRVSFKANRYREYVKKRCAELGLEYEDVTGPSLKRYLTGPRQLIWYEMKTHLGLSYPRIAREFGERDHTTIMAGVKRITKINGDDLPQKLNSQDRLLKDRELNSSARKDYKEGSSVQAIAIKFDISPLAVAAVAKIENWSRDRRDRDNRSRSAQVNLPSLRAGYLRGLGISRLAEDHGISVRTVRRHVVANGWKRAADI
jgi:hypothetical protein